MNNTWYTRGHPSRGFTLIELMIVVAIVAILSAIAYPAYTDSVRKGRRAEARAALADLLQAQERYLTQNGSYATFAAGKPGTLPFKGYAGSNSGDAFYDLGARQCSAISGTTPTLRDCIEVFAQLRTGFSDPLVDEISVNSMGQKKCTGTDQTRCWK